MREKFKHQEIQLLYIERLTLLKLKFSDPVENIVGKGEIACYEQFLLFPQCFPKLSVVHVLK